VIRNVRFGNIPGRALRTITMVHTTHNGAADTSSRNETYVYDYQGQVGNSFRVYFLEQATQNIAGGLAPCNNTTSRPEIRGITCPMTGSPPTPPPPPPLAPSAPGNVRIIR
jgi:hypothetical protein